MSDPADVLEPKEAAAEVKADASGESERAEDNPSGATSSNLTLSKNQQKKLAKRQRWEESKHERRAEERKRKKQKKKEAQDQRQKDIAEGLIDPEQERAERAAKKGKEKAKEPFDISVIVDLGFDQLMTDKEILSICQQLSHLYSSQRHSPNPVADLYYVGEGSEPGSSYVEQKSNLPRGLPDASTSRDTNILNGIIGKAMEASWKGMWKRWKHLSVLEDGGIEGLLKKDDEQLPPLKFANEMGGKISFTAYEALQQRRLAKEDIIYLTADSSTTIYELEPGKAYVIGGIVDKNRYKNLCSKKAEALGFATARLPVEERFLQLPEGAKLDTRKVLTVNQVFDILIGWCETRDWTQALARGFPMRKLKNSVGKAKTNGEQRGSSQEQTPVADDEEDEDAAMNEMS